VFRRRHPIPLRERLRRWLWPHIGWRRLGLYLVKRLTRLPGSPHSIAAGFACGAAISFTPFIGLHTLLSVLLSFLVRGNYLAAIIGTLIGNPWTFPLIWLATYHVGHFLLGTPALPEVPTEEPHLTKLFADLQALIWPLTVGAIPLAIIAALATYFPVLRLVAAYQEARRRRRARRHADRLATSPIRTPGASPASPDAGLS
jgi:uncharacterized protein (DUF2062 family)